MSASECQVHLHRDALSTPWGFRLQGGKDFKTPLTVQRVFVGSPADGELHRGDIIVSIDNYDATHMIHKQAMDVIKQAGGSMTLRVRKSAGLRQGGHSAPVPTPVYSSFPASGPQYRSRTLENISSPTRPAPTMYGHDYGSSAPSYQQKQVSNPMLNKLQHTLTHAVWSPHQHNDYDEDYHPQSVSDLKSTFDRPQYIPPPQEDDHTEERIPVKERKRQYDRLAKTKVKPKPITIQRPLSYNTKPAWVRPEPIRPPAGLDEPGWTPANTAANWSHVKAPQAVKYQPLPQPQYHSSQPQHHHVPPPVRHATQAPRHFEPDTPAWAGTLKSSGGYKQWEVREAEAIAGPGVAPPPPQHRPQHQQQFHPEVAHDSPHVPVHQPRVQNLHYGPGDTAPTYSQSTPAAADSDTAQIKHLQYNSPMGLYSKTNVEAALHGQTQGKPGQGTMQVTGGGSVPVAKQPYDPNKSDVYKLLHEEEQRKKGVHQPGLPAGAPSGVSARYQEPSAGHQGEMHYQGYMDHSKQSPAMGRLEQRIADGTVGTELGTSDF